ncbi:MAG: MmgE/PrpD family protein [Nitrososphaerales archaeon]|nr:MmgE/PrpD family protein [Nitrososphaerales archaeon]
MALADVLADYFYSVRYSDLDARTVKETKRRLIDSLGCALGAFKERPVRIARRAVAGVTSGKPATLLGTKTRTSADLAAFVNGLMIRYFDFNDTYLSREPAHPSDNIGATLSVAESEGSSGRELILATVMAYEVQCRFADAADLRHRGWDHVNYGLVSTTLAASRLMGSTKEKAAQAVNIALNSHLAMRQVRAGALSMWKGASFANAARNGVFSARLAGQGMTGPSPVFEGEMGFFKQVSGEFVLDPSSFGGDGAPFKIGETYIKYWPAEYHAQTAIWAALELRKRIADPTLIESVRVETHEAGYTILGKDPEKWNPKTKETADHSLPFIVATALLDGKVGNSSYSTRKLADERTLGLARRVAVTEDARLTELYPDRGMGNRITVTMKGGGALAAESIMPRGHPGNPMSDEEVEAKFMSLTRKSLGDDRARKAINLIWALDESTDLARLISSLVVRK